MVGELGNNAKAPDLRIHARDAASRSMALIGWAREQFKELFLQCDIDQQHREHNRVPAVFSQKFWFLQG